MKNWRWQACLGAAMFAVLALSLSGPALAQDHGGGGGGGGGCGDVFGDLVEIKRDAVTGQPILQKRWIEYPMDIYDWGYCPIPIDASGNEIPFVELTCDPVDVDAVVEVDYFGRLNGGRTKERNNRMHFNEIISSIKDPACGMVKQDETGRLMLGYGCAPNGSGSLVCTDWAVVDSPMESMGLYVRLMKYGHIQTDPLEEDLWAHGDPALGTQYHPALAPEDWAKFHPVVRHLLPGNGTAACFGETFDPACAAPESLDYRDFVRAAAFLGGAANKTGQITVDLVQYFNRIVKITKTTEATQATLDTLPALIRLEDGVTIVPAPPGLPAPANERFVDFSAAYYEPIEWREETIEAIQPILDDPGMWKENYEVELFRWIEFRNGRSADDAFENVIGFVNAGSDTLRSIEFVHNYAIPEDLGWDFGQ